MRSISATIRPAILLAALGATAGMADTMPASTYVASCRNIGIAGSTLYAECRGAKGAYKQTSLRIAGVENHNGALHYTTMYKASNFQDSCRDIVVAGNTLTALCRRDDGGFVRTSIPVPGLVVDSDGDLRYGPSPPPGK